MLPTTQYIFSVGGNLIDFTTYPDFDPKRLLAVINASVGQTLIYATGGGSSSPTGGSFSGSIGSYILTLAFNTGAAGMSDTDILQIIYDESVGTEEAKASTDIVSGRLGLDCNLLNSSFGGTLDDVMPAPFQDNALSIAVLNGGVLSAPAMNVNNELIVDCTQSGTIPISGSVGVAGSVSVDNFPASQPVTGTFFPATQPVSATALPLPTGASTSALQTSGNASLTSVDGKLTTLNAKDFSTSALQTVGNAGLTSIDATLISLNNKHNSLGQKVSASSMPVVIASDQVVNTTLPDLFITGQSAQTAIINNILPSTSSATATDCSGYKSFSIQVASTATAGTYIVEGSNNNVDFEPVPIYNQALTIPIISVSTIIASATKVIWTGSVQFRYLRLRIVTTLTGGSVQAFTRLSQNSFAQTIQNVSQSTAANLNATVAGALTSVGTITTVTGVTTVSSITSANLATSSIVSDVASAALTTTTTTATITPAFGISYQINIPVTIVSGTSPTLDVTIEESDDTGANWYKVYDFPRITGTGIYRSPHIPFFGNRVRYVQTVGGTTPSFTRSINRLQSSYPALPQRQLIDRTISLTTLNSSTPILLTRDCGNATQLIINVGAITTTAPAIQLEGSDDFGTTWYSIGSPLTAVASSTVQITVSSINAAAVRARVSTAGVGVTAGYVMIKAHD